MNSTSREGFARWGLQITGHTFDLQDWEETLRPPSDLWVERSGDMYVLRWAGFDGLEVSEVHARAEALAEQINGAMQAARGTRPVRTKDVLKFMEDGTRVHHIMHAESLEARSRVSATVMRIGPDGVAFPETPTGPSDVQQWMEIADADDLLADALVYLGRGEWFDLFKAIECVEDKYHGEAALKQLGWIENGELKRVKQTANSFRHRRGGRHTPPASPVTYEEARHAVGVLVQKAFTVALADRKI